MSLDPSPYEDTSSHAILERAIGERFIGDWNDAPGRTHAEVLEAFDRAIALAEAAP
jgi:hypothetical protein